MLHTHRHTHQETDKIRGKQWSTHHVNKTLVSSKAEWTANISVSVTDCWPNSAGTDVEKSFYIVSKQTSCWLRGCPTAMGDACSSLTFESQTHVQHFPAFRNLFLESATGMKNGENNTSSLIAVKQSQENKPLKGTKLALLIATTVKGPV